MGPPYIVAIIRDGDSLTATQKEKLLDSLKRRDVGETVLAGVEAGEIVTIPGGATGRSVQGMLVPQRDGRLLVSLVGRPNLSVATSGQELSLVGWTREWYSYDGFGEGFIWVAVIWPESGKCIMSDAGA